MPTSDFSECCNGSPFPLPPKPLDLSRRKMTHFYLKIKDFQVLLNIMLMNVKISFILFCRKKILYPRELVSLQAKSSLKILI